jgi:hypothetical protein
VSKLFDGDVRVWRWAAIVGLPLAAVVVVWCLVPRPYYVGTDSVNTLTVSSPISAGTLACQAGLNVPAGTSRIQLSVVSGQALRPRLRLIVRSGAQTYDSVAPAAPSPPGRIERLSFRVGRIVHGAASAPASLCVRGGQGAFALGGTPTTQALPPPFRIGVHDTLLRLSVWYQPRGGATRSYVAELGTIFDRAALFSAGFVAPWMLWVMFLVVLPIVALLAVRCLAMAAAGRGRRLAVWLYILALVNAVAWSLITPAFQGPDEVDHFAYVQSLAERGLKPTAYPTAPALRWSTAEQDALLGTGMLTDHQSSDSRAPGLTADRSAYQRLVERTHPRADDGGGEQATSGYGPLYYLALTPGYLAGSGGSVFTQLELGRLISALMGALASVFAFLTVRELAPRRPFLAVLAGLLVGFQPMYSFLSGTINNDIGIDAGAAAVAWLLVRVLRRGFEMRTLAALGVLSAALPFFKDSAFELYPLIALALGGAAWRFRAWQPRTRRSASIGLAALAMGLVVVYAAATVLDHGLTAGAPSPGAAAAVTTAGGALSVALHQPITYLVYLWEVFLPRLPGMSPHFVNTGLPVETIITRRAWAAFGWYDTFFPSWVYRVLDIAMLGALVLGVVAAWRERRFVRAHSMETALLVLFPIVIVAAFEAVFFTAGARSVIAEMGRYVFPANVPLSAAAVGVLFAFGRRWVGPAGTALAVVMLVFCYASQALTLTAFFS